MIEKLVAELEDRQKIHVEQGTGLPPDAYERVRSVLWSAITESVPREAAKSKLNSNEERLVFDRDMLPESQAQFVRRLLKDWRVRFTKYERPLYIYGLLSVLWKLFPGGRHPFEDVVWLIGTEFRYEPNAKIKRDPETGSCAIIVDVDIISRLQTFSMAIADILLRNKLIDFYRVPTREGIWPSIKLTAKTASFVTSNDYHSRHILYHALLNCALGERYLILMEGSNGAFALARKIFLNGLAFVIAHEFGHDAFGHLLPHPPKARGSFRDTPLFRTAFDEAELLRKCDEATGGHGSTVLRRYLNTTFNSNIKELDADGLALHACFHWEWSIGRDPY
ncbi:MAG: hypothetical protein J0H99_04200, partial [Rhodospirillales bacterium]|nr:hypothetical protein [Rhodospirillales bacterium]